MATKQLKSAAGKVKVTASGGGPSTELTDALRNLAQTVAGRAAGSLTKRITSASGRLNDYAGGGGGGLAEAVTGAKPGVKGKAAMGAVKGGLSGLADKVKNAFTGGNGGDKGEKIKLTNIVEEIDIGAPVDLVYDQWTRFTEFPRFTKKVESVEQVSDEKLEWKAQIFWSHRSWEATILEQVPGERIVWRSKGQKGYVDGAVTFHELAADLTRVVLVLAYHPQGLFERTGNLWRAQGRRARLELKHFRRHVMTDALLHPDDVEGWPGEIRDGQVVDDDEREPTDEDDYDEDDSLDEEPEEDEPEPPGRRRKARANAGRERGSTR
ncbi:SRPBCC family protein [Amycolatopsis sp. SID8362]|uniref:SRPBCC family protein n=1 Tax=Amycolatopsis sp. SID8362 TaxID=2690346 RepID=UPI00136C7231|nr:SRPBCC family protein [Amycolatopsis sp. SID8362]NBH01745.1 cyclase [Amycolatopsis sp. SID8362]NED38446.1 SRPBCC family protein [Amycolatopsis sp. SID8362]